VIHDHDCCDPILHGTFERERLVRVGLRHTGVYCAGKIEGLVKEAWFHQGRRILNGKVYE
jgi:hypothetical protein